jgi:hypothetical protein
MKQNMNSKSSSSFDHSRKDEFQLYDDVFERVLSDILDVDERTAKPFPYQKVFITAIDADGRVVDAR